MFGSERLPSFVIAALPSQCGWLVRPLIMYDTLCVCYVEAYRGCVGWGAFLQQAASEGCSKVRSFDEREGYAMGLCCDGWDLLGEKNDEGS